MDYVLHTFSNGLRLAYKRVSGTRLVNCGYMIHAGSRNDAELPGLAHCLEHMVFKGTKHRKTIHVLNHLEVVGGEMNAFTTKEITAIYATVRIAKAAVTGPPKVKFSVNFPVNPPYAWIIPTVDIPINAAVFATCRYFSRP